VAHNDSLDNQLSPSAIGKENLNKKEIKQKSRRWTKPIS